MSPEERAALTVAAAKVARIAFDVATGDRTDAGKAARELLYLAIDMIPVAELRDFLSERDRIFADLEADVLEQLKLEATRA